MASGKQTSFQFGEVSPSLRFRSDAVSYTDGLAKLKNMYVRKTGGISNRAGFELLSSSAFQQDIPGEGGDAGVKGFFVWDSVSQWKFIEYGKLYNDENSRYEYGFRVNTLNIFAGSDKQFFAPLPKDIAITPSKHGIFVAPSAVIDNQTNPSIPIIEKYNVLLQFAPSIFSQISSLSAFVDTSYIGASVSGTSFEYLPGGSSVAPKIPASYLINAINQQDVEVKISSYYGAGVFIPNEYLRNDLVIQFGAPPTIFKKLIIYRAAAPNGTFDAFYKYVGQIPIYSGSGVSTFKFADFGAEDPSTTPPFDSSWFITGNPFAGANAFAYYQQRMIAAMEPDITDSVKSGDIIASKLGAPLQFSAPQIYTNTGAFQFSVPITDGSPVVAMLAMERLIAFTERGVYAIRGGEQGALTPTSVNPILISEEGCSKTVQPKMSGFKGYFINNAHTKLMFIIFGDDGNLRVGEASIFSDHLLLGDVTQIEVLSDSEDTIYILKRDGKLVRITVNDNGAHGFSIIETSGYIESIFRGKAKKLYVRSQVSTVDVNRYYDVLGCYIIRNGVRYLERLNVRDDYNREGELFLDSAVTFGSRLSENGSNGYTNFKINIQPNDPVTPTWLAGDIIKIRSQGEIFPDFLWEVLHFYYDDNQYIRYHIDLSSQNVVVDSNGLNYEYSGYFDVDVPNVLRNVIQQSLSQIEKNKRLTRWNGAFRQITSQAPNGVLNLNYLWDIVNVNGLSEGSYPIAVVADGEIISSPLNPFMPVINITKEAGIVSVDLGDYYSYGYVGIPYECEFETLDLETAGGRTITDTKKLINAAGLGLMETRGGFAGIPEQSLDKMEPIVTRDDTSMNNQTKNFNGHIVVHIPTEWNEPGRVAIKHVDPAPISILSVYPKGLAGD